MPSSSVTEIGSVSVKYLDDGAPLYYTGNDVNVQVDVNVLQRLAARSIKVCLVGEVWTSAFTASSTQRLVSVVKAVWRSGEQAA